MGRFSEWMGEKNPKALRELGEPTTAAAPPLPGGGDEEAEPVDKNGVKLSSKMENYLNKLLAAMDNQKLSKKKQVFILEKLLSKLKGGGMTDTTALTTARNT